MYRDHEGIFHFSEARVAKGSPGGGRFVSGGGDSSFGQAHGGGTFKMDYSSGTKSVPPEVQADFRSAVDNIAKEFPGAMASLHTIAMGMDTPSLKAIGSKSSTVMGSYWSFKHTAGRPSVSLNPKYFGHKEKDDLLYKQQSAHGFLADTGASAARSVLTHEIGHHLDQSVRSRAKALGKPELNVEYEAALAVLKPVSSYAKTNIHEKAAEGFAAGFLNPAKHPDAAKFVDLLRKIYG